MFLFFLITFGPISVDLLWFWQNPEIQDGRRSYIMTQLLRHETSSPYDADLKGHNFRRTIYPPNLTFKDLQHVACAVTNCWVKSCPLAMLNGISPCNISALKYSDISLLRTFAKCRRQFSEISRGRVFASANFRKMPISVKFRKRNVDEQNGGEIRLRAVLLSTALQ